MQIIAVRCNSSCSKTRMPATASICGCTAMWRSSTILCSCCGKHHAVHAKPLPLLGYTSTLKRTASACVNSYTLNCYSCIAVCCLCCIAAALRWPTGHWQAVGELDPQVGRQQQQQQTHEQTVVAAASLATDTGASSGSSSSRHRSKQWQQQQLCSGTVASH
jgi:hypothetical protein